MSASLQYSNYSGKAAFAIPYEILTADDAIKELYMKSCQSDLDCYEMLCNAGISHDAAGYATPHGLRNVLIISPTLFAPELTGPFCQRNHCEEKGMSCRNPIPKHFIPQDILLADYPLHPGEIVRIPLGFGLIIPDGFAGYVFPRSSLAAKGLVCELPPIDSGYRGEIHAIISNISSETKTLHENTRVGQLVITPVLIADFVLDLGKSKGNGAFGSTGE